MSTQGELLRDDALTRVDANAPSDWKRAAAAAVREIARRRAEFTTDAVWFVLERDGAGTPPEPRAMGAVMQRLAREGVIEATDRTRRSVRPECHARPVRVWRRI